MQPHKLETKMQQREKKKDKKTRSANQQTQPQRQTETGRQRNERRPSQKGPTRGPQSHRTFTLELHSTPKEREGNGRHKWVATNGTDSREERERRNNKEETTQHKAAKESFSHESTSVSTQATSLGKTGRSLRWQVRRANSHRRRRHHRSPSRGRPGTHCQLQVEVLLIVPIFCCATTADANSWLRIAEVSIGHTPEKSKSHLTAPRPLIS